MLQFGDEARCRCGQLQQTPTRVRKLGATAEEGPLQSSSRQSVAYATDELMALVGSHMDVSEGRALEARSETIVLRDNGGKKLLDYLDTIATDAMRRDVLRINESLTDLRIFHLGRRLRAPIIRRIFNGSFERGADCTSRAHRFRTCEPTTGSNSRS